jgi:CBS domain-containing protein
MQVSEIMTKNPACCTPDTKLADVAKMMLDQDCGAIPVCEGQKAVGMVTDRDITVRAVACGKNPLDMCARDIMSTPVVTVNADMDVEEACDMLEENGLRRVIVVDGSGCVCGIVAQADIAENLGEDEAGELVQAVSMQPPSPQQSGDNGVRAR